MIQCPQPRGRCRKHFTAGCTALLVLLALLGLVGCQGLSAGAPSDPPPSNGELGLNGSKLDFGTVVIGKGKTMSMNATNSGSVAVTITDAVSTATQFTLSKPTLPMTVAPGQSASLSVNFNPTGAGAVNGTISITSDATNSPASLLVDGDGALPGALSVNPVSMAFGSILEGNSQKQSGTLTNSGGSDLTISQATVTGAGFSLTGLTLPFTLSAGLSANFSVTFAPQSAGAVNGNIAFVSDGSNPTLNLPLSGTGLAPGSLTPNPASLDFGNVVVGDNKSRLETLTNSSGTPVTISQATVSGAGFSITGLNLPATIPAGQSTSFNVVFAPTSAGPASGSLAIVSDASNSNLTIPLAGTAVTPGTLSANPTSINFGNVKVGNNKSLNETVTNTGGSDVTISQRTLTGTGFSTSGLNLPLTLTPGQKVTFSVIFTPQSTGTVNGNLTIISDASNPSLVVPLSGTGVAPGTLSANPTSLNFGNVKVGNNKSLSETVTNTGGSDVTISQRTLTGTGFSTSGLNLPLTLTPGGKVTFSVIFTPQSPGSVNGNLTIVSDASNPSLVIPLSGTGVAPGTLSANPTSLNFGNVKVGNNKPLSETVTNTGGSDVTISQRTLTGTGFSVSGLNLPLTLTPGGQVTFSVIFTPQSTGTVNGNLTIISDASNPNLAIPLSGTGTAAGQLSVTPASLDFGDVVVGNNSSLPATLNATGASVTVSSGNSSNSEFTFSGLTFPFTIQAGNSKGFTVTFTPQATGVSNATLTFNSDASNSPTIQVLTGTGKAPTQHSVLLSWTASISQGVVGYNVYRGTASGGPYSKIHSLEPDTSYTDTTVSNGQTYYYVTRAVDSSNQESVNSNEAAAVIPPS